LQPSAGCGRTTKISRDAEMFFEGDWERRGADSLTPPPFFFFQIFSGNLQMNATPSPGRLSAATLPL
jgi:hypothetical protein